MPNWGEWLRELLPRNAAILDLMSSWRSHLPAEFAPSRVMGLGMNDEEMAENPQLNEHIVHSLNADPTLPFVDEEFDAALCTVSVQYLTQPLAVFAEVNRVLRPGRTLCGLVLQPLLPHQSRRRLALDGRRGARRTGAQLLCE